MMQHRPKAVRQDEPRERPRSETGLFLRQFLRNPGQVSSLAPTSHNLSRALAACVPAEAVKIAEFGGGTGRVTRALLDRGGSPGDLTVFEINPVFVARLSENFPGVVVHQGPAQDLAVMGPAVVDAVVSSLPLLSMPTEVREAIFETAFAKLGKGGVYVQFTYGMESPAPASVLKKLQVKFRRSRRIWANLPPATIFTYERRSDGGPQAA
jgi:phosphatidylethanolamine/phosphatidyl-N-methylethanolamine N-methyltransferase